ncbi:hypothetical protein ACSBR2_037153 [Camellia fascicularis]
MAVSQSKASLIALMAVVVTIFSLIGGSLAAEALPSPVAAAGAVSPSFAVGCIATFAAFILGSALKI